MEVRIFQPARDAVGGEPHCAHCDTVHNNINALRRHIENHSCTQYDPQRPLGPHVPHTWTWLMQLAADPKALIEHADAHKIMSTFCVLCGRHIRKPGALIAHLLADHAEVVHQVLQSHAHRFQEMIPSNRACVCDLKHAYEGHRCHVLYQAFLLHHLVQQGQPSEVPGPSDMSAWLQQQWLKLEIDDGPMHTCAVCSCECGNTKLLEHLQSHAEMSWITIDMLELAAPPFQPCCHFCQEDQLPEAPCPVSFNLCLTYLLHGHGSILLHGKRGLHGTDGGSSSRAADTYRPSWTETKKRRISTKSTAGATTSRFDPSLGTISSQAREPTASHGSNGSIRAFFTSRGKGSNAFTPSRGSGLEGASTAAESDRTTEATPPPPTHEGFESETGTAGQDETRGQTLAGSPSKPNDQCGRHLAVFDVGQQTEAAGENTICWDPYGGIMIFLVKIEPESAPMGTSLVGAVSSAPGSTSKCCIGRAESVSPTFCCPSM